jgi:hypothetical protein
MESQGENPDFAEVISRGPQWLRLYLSHLGSLGRALPPPLRLEGPLALDSHLHQC